MIRQADLVELLAIDLHHLHAVSDQDLCLNHAARRDDGGPFAVFQATLFCQGLIDLAEKARLQLRQVRQAARHRTRGIHLGEAIGGKDKREHLRARLTRLWARQVVWALNGQARRRLLLFVQHVVHRGLVRLIVGGQWAVGKPGRCKEPTAAICLHNEGIGAIEGVRAHGVDRSLVVRGLGSREVRHVIANPLTLVSVPPHILLALGPRRAVRLRRGTVVEQAAVGRPYPTPLGSYLVLLRPRYLARGLINAVLKHAGIDPATARGAAVILHLHEGRQKLALLRAL